MKKFIILITLITISHFGFSQMTTIYEGGANTFDSLYTGLPASATASTAGHNWPNPDTLLHSINFFNDGNYGTGVIFKNWGKSLYQLYRSIPEIANYGYINYYINYTISNPNALLSILSSDSMALNSHAILNDITNSELCGNVVSISPQNMIPIADTNYFQDSVIKLQVHMPAHFDSLYIDITYFRVDVDLSSYMMFATDVKEQTAIDEFSLFASNKNINISTSSNNPYQVNVFNINGQEIYQGSKNGNSTIPLETNSNGIYLVRIVDSQGKMISKKVYLN
ncbi:MAG: T9SS type A sorting domain-containing protein [Flavobacteriales bacterium]|nr:T9SS type A sorting domain-containing protein [Flavobacteriales bacterium]